MKSTPLTNAPRIVIPINDTFNIVIKRITSILPQLSHLLHHLTNNPLMILRPLILLSHLLQQYFLLLLELLSKLLLLLYQSLENVFHGIHRGLPSSSQFGFKILNLMFIRIDWRFKPINQSQRNECV